MYTYTDIIYICIIQVYKLLDQIQKLKVENVKVNK